MCSSWKFSYNSARWEGGCLYAGTGDNIQIHTQEYYQGYISYGNTFDATFINNYLYDNNSDTYNNGQSDIYLWPYTDFIFYNEECGGTGIKPTPYQVIHHQHIYLWNVMNQELVYIKMK